MQELRFREATILFRELSISFLGIENLKLGPVNVIQKTPVCLDCGYLDLVLPTAELEHLRKGT